MCHLTEPISNNNENVENVSDFLFLESSVQGSTNDIKQRIGLASSSFGGVNKHIWSNKDINVKLELHL